MTSPMTRRALLAGLLPLLPFFAAQPQIRFGAPINVSETADQSFLPALAAEAGTGLVHVFWHDFTSAPNLLWCAQGAQASFGTGAVCAPNVSRSWEPCAAADSQDRVHLVWRDRTGAQDDIYYSLNGPAGWSAPENISATPGGSRNPRIALDPQDRPHVIWEDDTPGAVVFYETHHDGASWSVSADTGLPFLQAAFLGVIDLACDSTGALHAVWQDGPDSLTEIYHAERPQGGPWGSPEPVSGTAGTLSAEPAVAVGPDDTLHCAWVEQEPLTGMTFEVAYSFKPLLGSWSAALDVSMQLGSTFRPDIAVNPADGEARIVWMLDGPGEIFYVPYPGYPPVNVSRSGDASERPALALDGSGTPYVAWQEQVSGVRDIFVASAEPAAVLLLAVPDQAMADVVLSWTEGAAPFAVLRSLTGHVGTDGVEITPPGGIPDRLWIDAGVLADGIVYYYAVAEK